MSYELGQLVVATLKRDYGPFADKPNLLSGGYDAQIFSTSSGEVSSLKITHNGYEYYAEAKDCKIHGLIGA